MTSTCNVANEARGLITCADIQRVPLRELAASVLMRETHRTRLVLLCGGDPLCEKGVQRMHRLRRQTCRVILREAARRC